MKNNSEAQIQWINREIVCDHVYKILQMKLIEIVYSSKSLSSLSLFLLEFCCVLPLFPTAAAPMTAIFTSDNEDFFRRMPRVVILV